MHACFIQCCARQAGQDRVNSLVALVTVFRTDLASLWETEATGLDVFAFSFERSL